VRVQTWLSRDRLAVFAALAGYLDGINAAAHAAAAGGSPSELIDQVSASLAEVLSLRSCVFQYGKAGLGNPARLLSNGQVVLGQRAWTWRRRDCPTRATSSCWWKPAASSRAGS
jgi:hypothetical protein